MQPEPQKEHAWLRQFEGEWVFEGECEMGPGQPPMKTTGREKVRSLGGLWIVADSVHGSPEHGESQAVLTIGYDPEKGRFVGSYIASMMKMMWIYEGRLDDAGRVLTLDCEGPDMTGGGERIPYQDIYEIADANTRLFRSRVFKDGEWREFMRGAYRRV